MRMLAAGLLWAGAGAGLLAANQPWWSAGSRGQGVTGVQATSAGAGALVLAGLAGALLGLWLGSTARRWLLVAVAGLFAAAVPVGLTATVPAQLPPMADASLAVLVETPWRWVFVLAVTAAAAGAVLQAFGHARPAARTGAQPDRRVDAWQVLDAGQDPTRDTPADEAGAVRPDRPE